MLDPVDAATLIFCLCENLRLTELPLMQDVYRNSLSLRIGNILIIDL